MVSSHIISQPVVDKYNAVRQTADTGILCHAPFRNIYFNQSGNAVACCYNTTHVLGTWPQDSIRSMWFGDKARALRQYIRENDLGGGCQSCAHQLQSGNFTGQMSVFDSLADSGKGASNQGDVPMPLQFEFSLTNTCNLECIMCGGYWSSAIRRNREMLAPLHSPYDSGFVDQLDEFLPHLRVAKFFGGEPFLIRMYHEIWERIRVINPDIKVYVTTNGTTLTHWARELLDSLQVFPIISIDSMQRATFESIRPNAVFETVMANLATLQEYSRQNSRTMSFAVCPMQQNWQEMPDIVAYCNQNRIGIYFNTVYYPDTCSLSALSAAELDRIIARWESKTIPSADALERQNVSRFRNVINQVVQWQKEAAEREHRSCQLKRVMTDMAASLEDSRKSLLEADNISEAATAHLKRVFTIFLELPESGDLPPNANAHNLDADLGPYLVEVAEKLDAVTFIGAYFDALGTAYLTTQRQSTEADRLDFTTKVKIAAAVASQHSANEKVVETQLVRGVSGTMRWLAAMPVETLAEEIEAVLDRLV